MNDNKSNRLPRIIKIFLDIIYGLLLFVIVGLVIWIAISPVLTKQADIIGTASIPVALGTSDESSLEIEFFGEHRLAISRAWIDEARGTLRLETGSSWLLLLTNGSKLVLAVGLAYIFHLLRKVMTSILAGDPFGEGNSSLIRRLGYTFLAVGFGGPIVQGLAAQAILKRLPDTTPALHPAANFDARIILGTSLLIFLLSQIWSYGMELEQDRALTV